MVKTEDWDEAQIQKYEKQLNVKDRKYWLLDIENLIEHQQQQQNKSNKRSIREMEEESDEKASEESEESEEEFEPPKKKRKITISDKEENNDDDSDEDDNNSDEQMAMHHTQMLFDAAKTSVEKLFSDDTCHILITYLFTAIKLNGGNKLNEEDIKKFVKEKCICTFDTTGYLGVDKFINDFQKSKRLEELLQKVRNLNK